MTSTLDIARAELAERRLAEEAAHLSTSLADFIGAAWEQLKPQEEYRRNWHIDAICEHLEAVSAGEIHRLQVWVPPGTMKSMSVSVFWHPWEWTTRPWLRYWGASYETRLAARLSAMSRDLITSSWYQERWGRSFDLIRDAEHYWGNDQGGTRLATAPESTGSGEHGHRILIDDPINAKSAEATSKVTLESANQWYDGTVSTRGIGAEHARVIIMQRLHEEDLAAHVLELEDWVVLCIPERFEEGHPYAWRGRAGRRDERDLGSTIGSGDPRTLEGELIWPDYRTESMSIALAHALTPHRAAGQLQQRPAAREGVLLKRYWWRFYDPRLLQETERLPRFSAVVQSVDTPLKDKQMNDLCAIQAWGVVGADRYLLDIKKGHMSYGQAKRAILEQAKHVRRMFPRSAHYVLIENAGYGVELLVDLKRELTGVQKLIPGQEGDKEVRATNASDALESGNCYLPGYRLGQDELSMPDEQRCPADVVDFIESCALFPNAKYDDDVDAWSQMINWLRSRVIKPGRTSSVFRRAVRA